MDVLATRVLGYPDENGDEREIVLTVFRPFEAKENLWKCGFASDPPLSRSRNVLYGAGVDFIQSFVIGLKVARINLEATAPFHRAHWQGRLDCGLPSRAEEKPASFGPTDIPSPDGNAGNMDVLTTRMLGCPDESGVERELLLTVYVPFKAEGEAWKCGFTFGSPENVPIRYGLGVDFIEALLDGLAGARSTFEGKVPKGWVPSGDLLDCADLPYKIGRSFWTDPLGKAPDMPDFSGG